MTKTQRSMILAILIFSFASVSIHAVCTGGWSYDDGYHVGCSEIGQTETFEGENYHMYTQTLNYAASIGQWNYRFGVADGYQDCRYNASPPLDP